MVALVLSGGVHGHVIAAVRCSRWLVGASMNSSRMLCVFVSARIVVAMWLVARRAVKCLTSSAGCPVPTAVAMMVRVPEWLVRALMMFSSGVCGWTLVSGTGNARRWWRASLLPGVMR